MLRWVVFHVIQKYAFPKVPLLPSQLASSMHLSGESDTRLCCFCSVAPLVLLLRQAPDEYLSVNKNRTLIITFGTRWKHVPSEIL
jgi:hypothetical protein